MRAQVMIFVNILSVMSLGGQFSRGFFWVFFGFFFKSWYQVSQKMLSVVRKFELTQRKQGGQ